MNIFTLDAFAKPLASVNGIEIQDNDVRDALQFMGPRGGLIMDHKDLKERFLNHLIEEELKVQQARVKGLHLSEQFKAKMVLAERKILAELLEEQWVAERTSDQVIKEYFEQNKEMFYRKEVNVSHVLLTNLEDAQMVINLINKRKSGYDFKALVRKYSIGNRDNGGSIGWIKKGDHNLDFEYVAFNCVLGDVCSRIAQTNSGFHVLKIDEIRYAHDKTFSSLKKDVFEVCLRQARHSFTEVLKNNATITVDYKSLGV